MAAKKSSKSKVSKSGNIATKRVPVPGWLIVIFIAVVAILGIVIIRQSFARGSYNTATPTQQGALADFCRAVRPYDTYGCIAAFERLVSK